MLLKIKKNPAYPFLLFSATCMDTWLSRVCHASNLPHRETNMQMRPRTCDLATTHSFIRSKFFCARLIRWNKCLSFVHFCSLSLTSFKSYNLDSLDSYLFEELHLFNMSAKAIYETDGKSLLAKWFQNSNYTKNKFAVVVHDTDWEVILKENPWLETEVSLNLLNLNLWFK